MRECQRRKARPRLRIPGQFRKKQCEQASFPLYAGLVHSKFGTVQFKVSDDGLRIHALHAPAPLVPLMLLRLGLWTLEFQPNLNRIFSAASLSTPHLVHASCVPKDCIRNSRGDQ